MLRGRGLKKKLLGPFKRRLTKVEMARPFVLALDREARQLVGKIAIVTGASGAIGRAIVLRLASEGATVHALGRSKDKLRAVVDEVAANGGKAIAVSIDLEDDAAITAFISGLDRVDVLINCAGGSARGEYAPVWEQSLDVIDRILRVNMRAAIACTNAAARKMVAQRSGRIVSVGSVIGGHGKAKFADYSASKGGLHAYMLSAAIELGEYGVTVNTVSPGIVPRGTPTVEELDRIRRTNVLRQICHEEDIAEAVCFLSGPRAGFITGQNLAVDGGRSLGLRGDG